MVLNQGPNDPSRAPPTITPWRDRASHVGVTNYFQSHIIQNTKWVGSGTNYFLTIFTLFLQHK